MPLSGNFLTGVAGQLSILRERQQTERVTESKCLRQTPQGVCAARKGTPDMLPGAKNASSEASVSDGMRGPISEGSLHYRLLLSDGDINDRGEDGEGFNTPVCSFRKLFGRAPSVSIELALKLTFFSEVEFRSAEMTSARHAEGRKTTF